MRPVAKRSVSVRSSRLLKRLLWLVHLVAVWIVFSTNIPSLLQGILLLLIAALGIKHAGMVSAEKNTTALILHGDGRIEKLGAGDTVHEVVLHPHTTVLPFLVILLYRQKNRLQSLVLLKDSLQAEDFRQLRLWLRWQIKKSPPK